MRRRRTATCASGAETRAQSDTREGDAIDATVRREAITVPAASIAIEQAATDNSSSAVVAAQPQPAACTQAHPLTESLELAAASAEW